MTSWYPNNCPVCGSTKPATWDLCVTCLDRYGDREGWPEWLVYLVADDQRLKYQGRLALNLEFSMPPDVMEEYEDLTIPEQLHTRPLSELCWSESSARMLIPRRPYEDEQTLSEYRQANGVIEEDLSDGL